MNKVELIEKIAEKTGLCKKDSAAALTATLDTIAEALAANEKVALAGFGTFEVKHRAARVGRNPQTKQEIQIPASKLPTFKAGKTLKDTIST